MAIIPVLKNAMAAKEETSKVVFAVQWYDVGKRALEGLNGVKKVERGRYLIYEINTVYFDSNKITEKEMKEILIKVGTYIKTIKSE